MLTRNGNQEFYISWSVFVVVTVRMGFLLKRESLKDVYLFFRSALDPDPDAACMTHVCLSFLFPCMHACDDCASGVCVYAYACDAICVHLHLLAAIYRSSDLSIYRPDIPGMYLSNYLPAIYLTIYLTIYPYLPTYLPACLPAYLPTYLPTYLPS